MAWLALSVAGCLFLSRPAAGGIYCNDPGVAIPDNGLVSDDQIVTDHLPITDLNVKILASHSWVGDLVFTLQKIDGDGAPTGQLVLMDRPLHPEVLDGCAADNVDLVLDDESENGAIDEVCESPLGGSGPYTPDAPLSGFDGIDIGGTWRLVITDNNTQDTGTLTQWCLITHSVLDVDGDGEVSPLTDGLLILRHRFGFTGSVLTAGAVDSGNCTRCGSIEIKTYLDELP